MFEWCGHQRTYTTDRNEQYQEELWRRSIDALRDHLSPEILDKYGSTLSPPVTTGDAVATATTEGGDTAGQIHVDTQVNDPGTYQELHCQSTVLCPFLQDSDVQ